jgi:hypothetical protein
MTINDQDFFRLLAIDLALPRNSFGWKPAGKAWPRFLHVSSPTVTKSLHRFAAKAALNPDLQDSLIL